MSCTPDDVTHDDVTNNDVTHDDVTHDDVTHDDITPDDRKMESDWTLQTTIIRGYTVTYSSDYLIRLALTIFG